MASDFRPYTFLLPCKFSLSLLRNSDFAALTFLPVFFRLSFSVCRERLSYCRRPLRLSMSTKLVRRLLVQGLAAACTKLKSIANMNPKVDTFLRRATAWREEIEALRAIALVFARRNIKARLECAATPLAD
jgi:hypothetical protein